MAEKNIKISGIGDVTRADFVRAITDPDKFKEFADQQGWGNKRRQLAWNSLHNYAQGVQNGEINEINDMHQIIDDTGARTNKQEKYNWIGSKFDANGATAAFMNQIAKGMQADSKSANKSLKSIPSVTSYLNQQWFGSNNPDWELFQKNDILTNGVYGIANRTAKIKEGLTKYKNELTTNGAQYNWDGVDKDALYKNLDAAIASSNVATYAPLGITSDYINNALATKDLSNTQEQSSENDQVSSSQNPNSEGLTDEQLLSLESNKDLADLAQANPAKRAEYIAQARERLANQITLSEQEAQRNTKAYQDKIAAQKQQQYNQEMLNWYNSQTFKPEYTAQLGSSYAGTPGGKDPSLYLDSLNFSDKDFELNSPKTISAIATSTKFKKPEIRTVKTNLGNQTVTLNNKLDVLAYMLQYNAKYNPNFKRYFTDVSSAAGKSAGSIYRINALKGTDGSYVYVRKNGNNYEFYRSKPMNILYKEHLARKHKLGGIITKFQQGGAAAYIAQRKQRQQQIQKAKEQQIQSQPQQVPFGRSSVKSMGKNTNTLTTADKVAIGAAAADFLASFTANPIANGAGTILTTGADLASDISHGASFGQAAGNAAMNLGMGLVGFIPGLGTATKAKKLKKILQVSSGAVQAYFIANNFKEGVKSLSKVLDGSASVQDYKNLIYGLQGVKGASNSVINTAKRRGAAKVIKELPDKFNAGEARYTFKSNGKETQRLTQAQVKELQEKGSEGVSNEIKQLLNGVVVKPSKTIKTKLGTITLPNKPIEYQYKPKGEIQKLLDDLQIQSQKSSMWNPGKQDYLSMTSEHNWSLPSISIGLGKNSTKEVIKRAKQSPKPNAASQKQSTITNNPEKPLQTHTITPEQQKKDIELLRKRFTSNEPLPIDNATRKAYEHYRKRPMTDQEIIELEKEQRASEVMEAFGNTKSNNTKGHNKNTNLPHKQSNKKKKTSRDNNIKRRQNGGVLYDYEFLKSVHAFKQGGIIKAQGGVKLNNIWAGKNQDYGYNTYLNKYFNNQDVLSWMRTHYVGDNATKQYADYVMKNVNDRHTYGVNNYNNNSTYVANEGINTFNTGYQNAGNTLNYTLFGNNTKDYTDKKGVAYGLINFTRPNKALATGDSYNANPSKAYIDNALGLQTYSRVASLTDPGIKAEGFGDWGKYWKEQGNTGAYYYIAPGDTSGKGQWIPTTDKTLNGYQDFEAAPQETSKKDGSVTNPDIGKKSIFDKGKEYLSKLTSNPGNLYNAVETGKYLLANKATNDIAKIKMPNYVISPKHTSYQVMDNLAQQNAYHSKAAETMNQTSRPLTSSGQLQTAAQQESMNNANKLYLQGNVERNTWLEGQKQQSYKAGLYNMESAVDTANANAKQAWIVKSKNDYEDARGRLIGLATNRQNWINALEKFNIIDPYVERKNAQQQYGLAKAQWDYQNDAKVLLAQQKYQQLLRQHQNDLNFNAYDTDEYRNLINAQKEAGARYYNNMYQVYGISNPGFKYKKGGKFEDISKFNTKEFYNTIRHSINTATKQSGDLSKLINTLFKKSNKK